MGIKWLKTATLEQPNCAASIPSWVGDGYEQRNLWEDDKAKDDVSEERAQLALTLITYCYYQVTSTDILYSIITL